MLVVLSLDPAEYIDPDEGAGSHVDDAEGGRNEHEVEGLRRQPEQTAGLKGGKDLVLAFLHVVGFPLHNTHSWKLKVLF